MQAIQKGIVSSIENGKDQNGNPTSARILPTTSDGMVTRPLVIPWWLRGKMGNLSPGMEVAYAVFDDGTGILLSRMDGEWSGEIPGDIEVGGDIRSGEVSFSSHTHTGVHGETSTPH